MCAHVWATGERTSTLACTGRCPPRCWRQSLNDLQLIKEVRLAGQWAPQIWLSLPPQPWNYRCMPARFQGSVTTVTRLGRHGWVESTSEDTPIMRQGLHNITGLTFLLLEMFIVNCFQRGPFKTSGNLPHLCSHTPDFPYLSLLPWHFSLPSRCYPLGFVSFPNV